MWPTLDQFFARGASSPLRGSAARSSLRSPSLRLTPEGCSRREERQFTEAVLHRPDDAFMQRWRIQDNQLESINRNLNDIRSIEQQQLWNQQTRRRYY